MRAVVNLQPFWQPVPDIKLPMRCFDGTAMNLLSRLIGTLFGGSDVWKTAFFAHSLDEARLYFKAFPGLTLLTNWTPGFQGKFLNQQWKAITDTRAYESTSTKKCLELYPSIGLKDIIGTYSRVRYVPFARSKSWGHETTNKKNDSSLQME